MRLLIGIRGFTALVLMAALSACGGGSSNQQASTSTSLNSIVFTASSPDAATATPSSKTFTATVSPGTIYLNVLYNATQIYNVISPPPSGTTATITVTPALPASLGAGVFNSTITVTGYSCADPTCSQMVSGNTQTVNVSYQIPPIVRFVAPYVVTAGVPGTVIIRGRGFQQFTVTGVTFTGPTTATTTTPTVLSDTEIEANYPALPAGTYAVNIQAPTSPVATTSLANLVVASAPAYPSATIASLSGAPQVKEIVYDAQRQAVLVAVDTGGGEVLRYQYSGGWGSATSAAINTLSDIALSADGSQLLALTQTALTPLDPTTLAPGTAVAAPMFATAGTVFKNLAVGNDNNAVVTTALLPSTATGLYVYTGCNSLSISNATCTPAFTQPASTPALNNSTAVASTDGSLITILQGDPTQTSPPYVYQYAASSDTFAAVNVLLNQNLTLAPAAPAISVYTPTGSTTANTYIVLSGTDVNNNPVIDVYDASYNLLGTLHYTNTTLAVAVDANAKRAYTFDSATSQVRSFALDQPTVNGVFPEVVASAVTLATNPGAGTKMILSPDGGTLFLAGSSAVVVHTPP